jgi:hypothetical protein
MYYSSRVPFFFISALHCQWLVVFVHVFISFLSLSFLLVPSFLRLCCRLSRCVIRKYIHITNTYILLNHLTEQYFNYVCVVRVIGGRGGPQSISRGRLIQRRLTGLHFLLSAFSIVGMPRHRRARKRLPSLATRYVEAFSSPVVNSPFSVCARRGPLD